MSTRSTLRREIAAGVAGFALRQRGVIELERYGERRIRGLFEEAVSGLS